MSTGHDPYDELAAMFITESDRTGSTDGLPTMTIETLLVGHLPVRAGLWLAPYADAIARDRGPTVLIRLDRDEPSVQLLRGPDGIARPHSGLDVREVIFELAGAARNWIVLGRPDRQPGETAGVDSDRVTILSSADPAAVVAAYDVVKHLAESVREAEQMLPRVALAILGADEAEAQRVFDRVNRTTTSFLDVEIDHVLTLAKMDADVRSSMYLDFPGLPCPTLQQVSGWIRQAGRGDVDVKSHEAVDDARDDGLVVETTIATPHVAEPTTAAAEDMENAWQAADDIDAAPIVEVIKGDAPTEHAASDTIARGPGSDEPASSEPARLAPAPVMDVEPKRPEAIHEPDEKGRPTPLAEHVKGLTPLRPRCPHHEHIELAVDARGRVHLLGREAAIRDLHCVAQWAKAHRELLAMACPEINTDFDGRITSHVFTDQPTKVSDLHGGDMRLHVLAPVEVDGKRGWYAAALN